MQRSFQSTSAEATHALGVLLGLHLPAGTVMTLDGDLGTGKTTLVRGLGEGLGVAGDISSPTYMLMQTYEGGRLPLHHFDAWMEGREKALLADGADEFLGGDGLAVIEWGSRVAEWLPSPRLEVRLGHWTLEERRVELTLVGASEGELAARLGALMASLGTKWPVEGLVDVPGRPEKNASRADSEKESDPAEPPAGPGVR